MRNIVILLILIESSAFCQNRRFESFESTNGKSFSYALNLPDGFDVEKTYPFLIGPGDGTKGSDKSFFWNVQDTGQFDWVLVEFVIWKEDPLIVAELLDLLNKKYNVEKDKFHMVGFSANSANTFKIGLQIPEYFTSITGIPGHPRTSDETAIRSLKGVKIQNIVGENDGYWLRSARDFDKLYKKLGIETTLDIIPNGGHVLKELIGNGFMTKMEKMR